MQWVLPYGTLRRLVLVQCSVKFALYTHLLLALLLLPPDFLRRLRRLRRVVRFLLFGVLLVAKLGLDARDAAN
jgi:hypothetical protein